MATATKTVREIGEDLVALCQQGKNDEAVNRYYADDVVSIEAQEPMKEIRGIDGVRGKGEWWINAHEVHSAETKGPYVNEDAFAVTHAYDITVKESGQRMQMTEVALYEVKDGKIVRETFYY